MKIRVIIISALTLLSITSCQPIRELHYFKDSVGVKGTGESKTTVSNYYRVTISGFSFLSSSRYVSGYFDQDAINLYFNEMSQPANGRLWGSNNTTANNNNTSLVTNENGKELVLVLSTNSKAISDQIGNVAKNQIILNSMAQITEKDKIQESNAVKDQISSMDADIQNFILKSDLYLADLDTKDDTEIKDVVEQYLKSLLK